MQSLRTGARWIAVTITSISITTVAYAVSVAPVASENGMVVVAQHLASKVGVEVLKRDDNTVDTAVAVGYALIVAYPAADDLGGGGSMTIQLADGRKIFLNFREVAPKAATVSMYLDKDGNVIKGAPTKGYLAVGAPDTVSGMEYVREKYGTMQRAALITSAITLADKGFVPDQDGVNILYTSTKDPQEDVASGAIFLSRGQPFQVGEKLVQHDLAKALREIGRHGTDGFYKGWAGQVIVASNKAGGGLVTQDDLVSYKTRELAPVECDYRGYHVVLVPPPSSGDVIICKMLNTLEGYPFKDLGWHSAQATHYQIEVMCYAHADRNSYLGDPDSVRNPLDRLLSKDYTAKICAVIDPKRAGMSKDIKPGVEPHEGNSMTYYSIVDKYGNTVLVTYALNDQFGAKVTATKTGVILNDEMNDFTAKAGVPNLYGLVQGEANLIAPDKRPLSSMSLTIVTKDGKPVMVVGTPGGSCIIMVVMLTMINAIDYGMNVQEAVDMSRFRQQWPSGVTSVEAYALSEDTRKILTSMGHSLSAPQSANHLAVTIVGAPSLDGKPIGNNRLYGANNPRHNTGLVVGY